MSLAYTSLHHTDTEFIITATTKDSLFPSLNKQQMIFSLMKFAQDRRVIANTEVINRMTKMQLISEMRMIREILGSGSKKILYQH